MSSPPTSGPVVGRFAPSPTGALHLGHVQTMLLAWLQVRDARGRFLLRLEDIDRSRSTAASALAIVDDLRWLGFDWDEGPDVGGPSAPYVQSARRDRHQRALASLADRTFACTCSRKELRLAASAPAPGTEEWVYPGTCRGRATPRGRPASIRVRVEPEEVAWDDQWLGRCGQDPSRVCGDFILWSKNDEPTYQLAVVVDDLAMGVTHVVRGDDLRESTARQILLFRWLGAPPPRFSHLPLRRDGDGQRLAKSRGSPGVAVLRARGADPREVLGQLAADLGLIPHPEPRSPDELLPAFAGSERYARLRAL